MTYGKTKRLSTLTRNKLGVKDAIQTNKIQISEWASNFTQLFKPSKIDQ